jgi:hypothetical protein
MYSLNKILVGPQAPIASKLPQLKPTPPPP